MEMITMLPWGTGWGGVTEGAELLHFIISLLVLWGHLNHWFYLDSKAVSPFRSWQALNARRLKRCYFVMDAERSPGV